MNLFLIQARANRLMNRRLLAAVATLSDADFHAPRTSFFPSLALTLNHVLNVDHYYIAALQGDAAMRGIWASYVPAKTAGELAARQDESDQRLIAFCEGLQPGDEENIVAFDRGAGIENGPREPLGRVLAHVFMHQTHHRGQAHAMLAGTAVKPPQLDDFIMLGDDKHRTADMAALGWAEPV
ncbi:DinB family protein [Roseateles sp. NT4]|uniref:DinB family protein n=1 Tax=Roseateles sp. NT4 TaxID=3453715 RepID=UPI003EEB2C18